MSTQTAKLIWDKYPEYYEHQTRLNDLCDADVIFYFSSCDICDKDTDVMRFDNSGNEYSAHEFCIPCLKELINKTDPAAPGNLKEDDDNVCKTDS